MFKLPLAALAVLAAAAPMAGAAGQAPKKLSLVPGEREPAFGALEIAGLLEHARERALGGGILGQ